nr:aldo/keto reductase [Maliibacterium massiliense]
MRTITLGSTGLRVPAVAVGCMRIHKTDKETVKTLLHTALAHGANFFDHADCYGLGACESLFAECIGSVPREKILLQSKCGNINAPKRMFDFSKAHILEAVDGILARLKTDYLDILSLHRPDPLMEPEQIAEAFDILHQSGKVRYFGLCNHNAMQIALLQKYICQPIVADQMQFSLARATMLTSGTFANTLDDNAVDRDGGVLDYCRLHDITIQAWSPLQYGYFSGVFLDNPDFPEINEALADIAAHYGVAKSTIALAWILRLPSRMQVITGTLSPAHLRDSLQAADITLTREEWYDITRAAKLIPLSSQTPMQKA